ncbi:hypothetical protein, partial [Xenorhabdus santafensis]|uniref:hypothetical protein n=1 Tax=Xenorhabdus santafensis TaxID=2582833 RepID=UPI0029E81EAD
TLGAFLSVCVMNNYYRVIKKGNDVILVKDCLYFLWGNSAFLYLHLSNALIQKLWILNHAAFVIE